MAIYMLFDNPADNSLSGISDFTTILSLKLSFLEFMCQSQLVVMPLDTEAPAGLIAFYQAAANGKMSITSDTVTTQEYFAEGRGALCRGNVDDWKLGFKDIH